MVFLVGISFKQNGYHQCLDQSKHCTKNVPFKYKFRRPIMNNPCFLHVYLTTKTWPQLQPSSVYILYVRTVLVHMFRQILNAGSIALVVCNTGICVP